MKASDQSERMLAEQSVRTRAPYGALYAAVLKGTLPATRVGKHWIVRDADADAFVAGMRPEPAPAA